VLRRRRRGARGEITGASRPSEHRWERGAGAADVVRPPVGAGDVRIVAAVLLSFVANTLLTFMTPVKLAEKCDWESDAYEFNSRGVAVETQSALAGVVSAGVQTGLFQEGVLVGRNFSRTTGGKVRWTSLRTRILYKYV